MELMSIKDARQQFARLISSAARGKTVAITRRGRVVAQIGPVSAVARPRLPDLTAFRATLGRPVKKSVATVRVLRDGDRY